MKPSGERRASAREVLRLHARLTWTDRGSRQRSARVLTRNMSTSRICVESEMPLAIPLFRLVEFRIDETAPGVSIAQERTFLTAVYRVSTMPPITGLALRVVTALPRQLSLLID
jgi:hypothetical protein